MRPRPSGSRRRSARSAGGAGGARGAPRRPARPETGQRTGRGHRADGPRDLGGTGRPSCAVAASGSPPSSGRARRVRREAEALVARAAAAATYDEERIARAAADARGLAEREVAAPRRARRPHHRGRRGKRPRGPGPGDPRRAPFGRWRRPRATARGRGRRVFGARSPASRRRAGPRRPRSPTSRPGWVSTRSASRSSSSSPGSARSGSGPCVPPPVRCPAGRRRSRIAGRRRRDWTSRWTQSRRTGDDETAELEAVLPLVLPAWEVRSARRRPADSRAGWPRSAGGSTSSARPTPMRSTSTPSSRSGSRRSRPRAPTCATAIVRTRTLIEELSTLIADQFRSTFRALETAFDGRFQQLFGGGFARLELTDPADLSATGVEIVARPPGKKAQALAMLSGGERALTAVALLFAMLEVRPGPVLRPGRGRRGARRGQRRAILRRPAQPGRRDPVHRHHPQPGHDRGGRRALRRDRRRRLGEPGDQPPSRRGAGDRRAPIGPTSRRCPARSRARRPRCSGDAVPEEEPAGRDRSRRGSRRLSRGRAPGETRIPAGRSPTSRTRELRHAIPTRDAPDEPRATWRPASRRAGAASSAGSVASSAAGRSGPSWDDVEETLIAGDVGATLAMDVVERARRRRDEPSAEAAVRAELAALLLPREPGDMASSAGGPGSAGGDPRRRGQRDRQDHDDRQARQPLPPRGADRAPGGRRHVPGRGHRAARDLGGSLRRPDRRLTPRAPTRARSSSTPSTPPWPAGSTSSSPTPPAGSTPR